MSVNILDLKGRVGLVTGAGQGVGRAVALRFAENNAGGVVVNDFRLERAEAVATEVEKLGVKVIAAQCDVTNFASVTAMFEKVPATFGNVDILVNNAGQRRSRSARRRAQTLLGTGAQRLAALSRHKSLRRAELRASSGSHNDREQVRQDRDRNLRCRTRRRA